MKIGIIAIAVAAVVLLMAPAASDKATVVRDPAIWNEGTLYRTVLTPTDLPFHEQNAHSFDIIYSFVDKAHGGLDGQRSVADAAPGDPGYNGGRWMVYEVNFTAAGRAVHDPDNDGVVNFELQNSTMVLQHADVLGHLTISPEPVKYFVCPMIKIKE